ncbi:hypothetical protein PVAR5_8742 [Paecilomyces variotii No. 5]|uniref:Phytanoyl-CoA dioxygenase family protein n=1 Tax=Byssochlamys spectabilis (strain No. 5 / NBRC 109023) TaxID=1356009 RepID=V5GD61_BYSSN|nr:hypothetical protein PVAR5_8742 [Paecilomyces variotii No. 5]
MMLRSVFRNARDFFPQRRFASGNSFHHGDPLPITLTPSRDEVDRLQLSSRNIEAAIRSLHKDGLVVIENVVDHPSLDALNEVMTRDAYALRDKPDSPFNYNPGNIQQDPPPVLEHFHKSIFLNRVASQVTSTFLGPRPKWTFCSGNTAMPPTPESPPQSQPVHTDADFSHPAHPFALVVNIPLITMTPENGSTEPLVKKGSVVIRDLRLWHAGKGNHTPDPRVMLAMIHFAPWYRNSMRLAFAEDIRSVIEGQSELEVPVDWISRDKILSNYLNRGFGNSYDFNQTP